MKKESVAEINELIQEIEKHIKPDCEIGSRERATLSTLLKANKVEQKAKYFACRREDSNKILTYFLKEKGLKQNKFSSNNQPHIYLLYK